MKNFRLRTFLIFVIVALIIGVVFCLPSCSNPEENTTESETANVTDNTTGSGTTETESDTDPDNSETTETGKGETSTSDETGSDETKTEGSQSNETESDETESDETESDETESDETNSDETDSKGTESGTDDETETVNTHTHNYDAGVVTKQPTCKETGTKLYTCTLCGATKEETLKVTTAHTYGDGEVLKEATCNETGTILYTCTVCGATKEDTIPTNDNHVWNKGIITKQPTYNELGIKLFTCSVCKETKEEPIDKLPPSFTITLVGIGEYFVGPDGSYDIGTYDVPGYNFIRWETEDGKEFKSKGTIDKNVVVTPVIEIIKTTSQEQLEELLAAGAEKIFIASDIVVRDHPIFVSTNVTIYADSDVSIIRAADYAGNIFVVGVDKDLVPSVLFNRTSVLTLGGGEGTLYIDGNRDNTTVTVVGTAILVTDSAVVNIYDGTVIQNHAKDGNDELAYALCTRHAGEWMATRAGGAAIMVLNGNVNMYGGVITNNWARTDYTVRPNEEGIDTSYEDAACGGAIYNCGNFNMYGGTISNNEALRGAAIYNDEIVRLEAGTIVDNYSHTYGGAISSSSAAEAQMFIGTEKEQAEKIVFLNNKAGTGGALYSNASSPIVILGNARFEGNEAQWGGGAIYTGGALTVRDTEFVGNKTTSSGGAIYFWYNYKDNNKSYLPRRHMELTGCVFVGNDANLGGAIVISASAAAADRYDYSGSKPKPLGPEGAYAEINDCTFEQNHANNCGALYVTRHSDVFLNGVEFTGNSAEGVGGAMSVQTGCTVTLDNIIFEGNFSNGSAGALYVFMPESISLNEVDFIDNQALGSNGGALYFNATTITLDDSVSFTGNKAVGHGGAIYASYTKNEDESLNGATLVLDGTVFENNTALAGGAISARSASTIIIDYVNFLNCQTPDAKSGEDTGGGAIYSNSSTLTMTGVTFDGCSSGYYGGVLKLYGVDSTLTDVTIKNASGGTGAALFVNGGTFVATNLSLENVIANVNGAIYAANVEAVFNDLKVEDCVAYQGGAIYASGETAVITINNGTFENTVAHNGGAIYAVKATVNLNGCTFNTCVATNGGAIFADQAKLNVSGTEALPVTFNGNNGGMASVTASDGTVIKSVTASTGGALYMRGSTVVISGDVLFNGYTVGYQGGAIYCKDYSYTVTTPADPEVEGSVDVTETVLVPSSLTVNGAKFSDNVATSEGGAIYFTSASHYDISNTLFENNEAKGIGSERGGGAIYSTVSTGYLGKEGAVTFIGNHSHKGGAVAIHSDSKLYVYSVLAQGNYADYLVVEETTDAGTVVKNKFGYGGVFYANSSHLYLEEREGKNDSIVFGGTEDGQGNYAVSGGVIYIEKNAIDPTLSVKGAEFINNRSTYVQGTSFNNSYGGGAIRASKTNITLTGVTLDGNSSDYYGGAVHAFGGTFTMDGGSVVKNNRGGTGAAIFLSGVATPKIADTEIKDNVSKANGIVYCSNSQLTLENVTATGNTAASGGVLYISGSASTLTVTGGKYEDNDAKVGGALWISGIEGASISGATFKNNEATSTDGGAIYLNATRIEITDSTFEANRAKNHGGAIALFKTVANLNGNNKFVGNVAENHGGAIHVMYVWNEDGTQRLPSELIVSGGIFDGNKALGGGAISIRSECLASFDGTTFINNEALGQEDTADGDGEGGGAIYNGWGTLHLTSSTLTYNKSQGHFGGAVNSVHGTTTISGTTTIKNNTNGVYVVGKDLMIRDTVIITDNERSNVYLNGRKLMLVGELSADSVIGVMSSKNGEFVVADGENVTDVLLYKNSFTADLAPIYEEGGKLLLGFFATQNPLSSNDYTFGVNGGAPTYQWQVLEGGIWIDVEGATSASLPATVATGKTYRCVATLSRGEAFIELTSTTLKYTGLGTQTHAVCGSACDHADHEALTWYPIGSIEELLAAGKTAGNYYLTCDLETSKSIKISADVNICLNGYTLSAANNESKFSIITVGTGASLNLTDCGENATKHTVYVKDGQLVDAGTEGAIEIELTGGIISGGYATTGGALYSVEAKSINVYNVNFVGNRATGQAGAVYLNKVGSNTDGVVVGYTFNNVTFVANSVDASKYGGGAIYTTNSHGVLNNATMIGNHSFKGGAVALHTTSTLTVNGLTAEHNFAQGGEYLDGETIRNGLGVGGVFYVNSSSLNIVGFDGDVNILNNSAVTGGVICVEWNNTDAYDVKISGANVSNNAATGNGGAISINAAKGALTVMNSTFSENNAANGGAIHFTSSSGTLTVDGSRFDSNTASGNGGAIYAANVKKLEAEEGQSTTSITINNTDFQSNTSNGEGGALYMSKCADYAISGGSFKSNKAMLCVRGGGAIYSTGSHGTVNGTEFEDNHGTKGGAIALHTNSSLTVSSATFTNNGAEVITPCTCDPESANKCVVGGHGWGGAIYTNGSTLNLVEDGGEISFSGNNAVSGGAIYTDGGNVTISGASFDQNTSSAAQTSYMGGGAIFVTKATLSISGASFTGNSSEYYGGAIAVKECSSVTITGGEISNNSGVTGGAIWLYSCTDVTLDGVRLENNTASSNGVIYTNSKTVKLVNLEASGNTSQNGLVYASRGTVTVTGGTFNGNSATNGGVLYVTGANVTVDEAQFTNNSATNGGAIYVDSGTVTVNGGAFDENSATNGGAIYACILRDTSKTNGVVNNTFKSAGTVTVTGASFNNNKASSHGGAIYATGATLTISGGRFESNVAESGHGGALYVSTDWYYATAGDKESASYQISQVTIKDNAYFGNNETTGTGSNGYGGAIYLSHTGNVGSTLNITGGTFEGNKAQYGGAIAGRTGTETTLTGVTFKNNEATVSGGAIYTNASSVNVIGGSFEGNSSTYDVKGQNDYDNNKGGGAIFATGSTLELHGVTLKGNSTGWYGGAITAKDGGSVLIDEGCIIEANVGATGAAFNFTKVAVTIKNSSIINNVSSYNGVVYQNGSTLTVENVAASGNVAVKGGVFFLSGSVDATITGGTYSSNYASDSGAVVYMQNTSKLTVNTANFMGNGTKTEGEGEEATVKVTAKGGVICVDGGTVTLNGGTFENNTARDGGAIYVGHVLNADKTDFTSTGALVATGTIFRNNEATGTGSNMGGGAICVNRGEATLNGVELDGNKSAYYGGAISAYDATVTIQKNGDKNSVIKNSVGETGLAITFKDSDGTNNGTYVINGLNLTDNNPAKDHGGNGVIYINEGELTVDGLTATGNSNTGSGVIHASTGAKLTVKNSKFESNSTAGKGAAINFVPDRGDKTLVVENTKFISNTATGNGGAINAGGSTVVTIANCTFTTNESDANGGAIYAYTDTTLCIDNSTFDGNKSLKGDTSSGGAIYGVKSTITITGDNTYFKNNQADRGGAIYITHANNQPSTLEMMGGKFEQNSAAEGGAISIRSSCTATFNGTSFINNTTDGDGDGEKDGIMEGGGAIYVGWATLNLSGVTLDQNSATNGTGGAILANGATFKISGKVVISNNKSGNSTASNVSLLNNTVITVVGALDPETSIGITAKDGTVVKGDGTNVTDVSGYVGMFFHDDNKPLYVDGTVLKSGLLVIQQPTRFNGYTFVTTCTDESHYKWYVVENGMPVIVDGATGYSLTNAVSGKTYVCIVTCGSTNVMSDNYYYCNEEPEKLVCGESCDHETTHETVKWLPISNAEELTLAGKTGGYYYLVQGIQLNKTVVIESNAFISLNGFDITLADGASGFSFFNVPASVTLTLTDWSSTDRGGYIDENGAWMPGYYAEATSFVSLKGGVINGLGNSATSGGAIYAEGNVVVYNVDFVNHTAGNGGAIYLAKGATLLTEGSSFVANECTSDKENLRGGGAVYTIAAKATFNNTSFYNNKAAYYGGAVVAYGSEVSFNGGEIKENNGGTGAAICFRNDSDSSTTAKYELTNVKITYNHATNNGIVYMQEGTLTMNGVEATYNTSDYVGGFMYVSGGVVNMADSTVQSNTAKSSGAIQLNGSGVKLNVSGKVIISGNVKQVSETESVSNNLELTNGKLYIAGALTEGSDIGVTANDGAFVTGVDGLDVADYVEFFTHDGGKPVYAEDGSLKIGFVVTQQPSIDNNYTVVTNGQNVTYQWFVLEGESWTEVAGATSSQLPDSAVSGNTYKCTVTLTGNGITVDSDSVTYFVALDPHEHTVCGNGTDCTHDGEHNSKLISWSPITSVSDLIAAGQSGGSFYLMCDIELDESVVVNGNLSLCLNGYTISAVDNDEKFSMITVSQNAELTLTDCGTEKSTIYVKDCVLVDSETEGATAVEITGGKIVGGHAELGGAIYSNGGKEINLYNVNFVGNTATSLGGACYITGDVTVYAYNTTFVANSAETNGGAVDIVGSTMTAKGNNKFLYNTANSHGGAIYAPYENGENGEKLGSTLIMTGGLFEGNVSGAGGGAVSVRTNGSSTFTSTIFNNNTSREGGAIYANNSELSATGCTFDGNSAVKGGAVMLAEVTATVDACVFTSNRVDNGTSQNNQHGGAIYASGASTTLDVINTEFTANYSGYYGGAIAASGTNVSIKGGSITGNAESTSADGATGAALWFSSCASVTVDSVSISDYHSSSNGVIYSNSTKVDLINVNASNNKSSSGLIYASAGTLTIYGGRFENNEATYGGVICAKGATIKVEKYVDGGIEMSTSFTGNQATNGGAIYVESGSVTVTGATFNNNTATNGGAIYVVGGTATVDGTQIIDNSATNNGGAAYVCGGTFTANGATFNNNTAISGGAVYVGHTLNDDDSIKTQGTFNATATMFERNNATGGDKKMGGGAVCVDIATATLSGVTMDGNSSGYYGGAISGCDSTVTIQKNGEVPSIIKNSVATTGLAICFKNYDGTDNGTYAINGVTLENNTAGTGSGVIYINEGELTVENLTATDNSCGSGVVHASSNAKVTIKNSQFTRNSTTGSGGAINFTAGGSNSSLTVENSTFTSNSAKSQGGAIFANSGKRITVTGCTFTENYSGKEGGAIYMTGCKDFAISTSTFIGNYSTYCIRGGGAVYMTGSIGTMEGSVFTGNHSAKGGAIAIHGASNVTVSSITLQGNYAEAIACACGAATPCDFGWGGAIYIHTGTLNLVEATEGDAIIFGGSEDGQGNSAKRGGAMYIDANATVEINGAEFVNNKVTGTTQYVDIGGAIAIGAANLTISNTEFTGNYAYYGGAIATVDAQNPIITVQDSTFDGNTSVKNGGALYIQSTAPVEDERIVFSGCTFINNDAGTDGGGSTLYMRQTGAITFVNTVSYGGKGSWGKGFYATTSSRIVFRGTLQLNETETSTADTVSFGSSASAIVEYTSEEEKTALQTILGTGSKFTYVDISTQQQ